MNTNTSFSIKPMLSAGWQGFKRNWSFIIGAGVVTAIIQLALQMIQRGAESGGRDILLMILATIFVVIVSIILAVGWAKTFLSITRTGSASWETFKTTPDVWLRYVKAYIWYLLYYIGWLVITSIVWAVLAIVGALADIHWLLVIGGILTAVAATFTTIYFSVRYQFLKYAVIDYPGLPARQIFRNAGALVKGAWWKVFWFSIAMGLVTLLGLICLVAGLVVAIPVVKLAETKLYTYLKEAKSL